MDANRTLAAEVNQPTWAARLRRAVAAPLLLWLLLALPIVVHAQYTYTTNNNQITITKYNGTGGAVIIPDTINGLPVTTIGNYAFQSCTSLTNVHIGDGVTNIASGAFFECPLLRAITVASFNPVYISLDGVLFNRSQTTLLAYPTGKPGSYEIPNSVTSIGFLAFNACGSLTNVTIPDSVTSIGRYAFRFCIGLTKVAIPSNVTNLDDGVFYDCFNLDHVAIPDRVSSIGIMTFRGCTNLASVTIPDSVTIIGSDAFKYCGLTSITIPNNVSTLGAGAFRGCNGLTQITIPSNVTNLGFNVFGFCRGLTSLSLPNTMGSIPGNTFSGCSSLTNVTIPGSVTNIGRGAFGHCTSLKALYFEGARPTGEASIFETAILGMESRVTIYYLPGAKGWGSTFDGRPTVLWNPKVQTGDARFGVKTGQFGFNVTGTSGLSFVVEAATDLAQPVWTPVSTNTLAAGTAAFSDSRWQDYPARLYRLRMP